MPRYCDTWRKNRRRFIVNNVNCWKKKFLQTNKKFKNSFYNFLKNVWDVLKLNCSLLFSFSDQHRAKKEQTMARLIFVTCIFTTLKYCEEILKKFITLPGIKLGTVWISQTDKTKIVKISSLLWTLHNDTQMETTK